jgi:hypothetical protein
MGQRADDQRYWNSELGMRNAERKKDDRGIGIRNWECGMRKEL